jgi:RND family efflux transporter MFP subunit
MESRTRFGPIVGGLVLLAVALGLAFSGINERANALAVVTKETRDAAVPVVSVIHAAEGEAAQEITLPGTVQPFTDAPIYARTTGYLRKWYADIGAHVKAGQLLADIDTPEVDRQLDQARADLATAEANAKLARTTAERYRELIKTDSVSRQDLDNANGALEARETAIASARANVNRLEQLHAFARIEAPFDGVITTRNVDVGALITSGSGARELFHVAAVDRLRVFVNVPQVYSRAARPGLHASLTLAEFPGRSFDGVLARTSEAIDVASRTLLTEIDVDNRTGELLSGSYVQVHLKLAASESTTKLPVNALIFGADGLRVAKVVDGKALLAPITIGRDYGDSVEVLSGLSTADAVIVNPPDSLESGVAVRVADAEAESK